MELDPEVSVIDQIRQRLVTLSGNIQQLQEQFHLAPADSPMPTWSQINVTQRAIAGQLDAVQKVLADPARLDFLRSAHIYPTASYPWTEENAMGQLLRKRLEPDVSSWTSKARVAGAKLERGDDASGLRRADWEELWNWAGPASNGIAREVFAGGDGEEDDDDENEDEDEEMQDVQVSNVEKAPSMNMNDVLRFTCSGSFPPPKPNVANGIRR